MADSQALYRFYDDGGQLLYVGVTNDPARRFHQHATTKAWWQSVRGIAIDWYGSRQMVEAAERRAIRVERPRFNIVRAALHSPAARCGHCFGCRFAEPCHIYDYDELDRDTTCRLCGRTDCLYGLGYENGEIDGWTARNDRLRRDGR